MRKKNFKNRKSKQRRKEEGKKIFLLVFSVLIAFLIVALSMKGQRKINYHKTVKFKPVFNFSTDPEQSRVDSVISRTAQGTFGVDLSHNQREQLIHWDSLKIENGSVPISFAIIRATMGLNGKDKHFDAYWQSLKNEKILRGAYHYYRPHSDPTRQADWYLQNVSFEKGDMLPILDVEVRPKDMSLKQFQNRLQTWLTLVERATGKKPIIYSFSSFYRDYLKDAFPDYPAWLANYNDVSVPAELDNPWIFWQFSEQGNVNGIDGKVDLNVFNGTETQLRNFTFR